MEREDSDEYFYEEEEEVELDESEEEEEEEDKEESEVEEDLEEDKEESDEEADVGIKVITNIDEKDGDHRIIKIKNPEDNITSEIIQREEMTEAIGIRISQIEAGAPCLTDVSGYTDPISMAKKEFIDRRNPLKLWRTVATAKNNIVVEEFKVRNMTFPVTDRDILGLTSDKVSSLLNRDKKIKRDKK